MFKKTLATALLVCTVPALANAGWFLSTQARSGGGHLDSINKTGQVVADGVLTTQQDVVADQTVSYTATNAKVQRVTLSDTSVSGTSISVLYDIDKNITTYPASYTVHPVDGHSYNVAASFAADFLKVSAAIDYGTVTPTSVGNIYYGYKLTTPLTFTFSPKAGYTITAVNNVPSGASVVGLPATANSRVTVTLGKNTVLTAGFALSATAANASPYVDAILPQTVTPGSVSMKAVSHNLGTPAFTWTYVSGPKNTAVKSTVTVGKDQKVITKVVPGPALTEFPTEVVNASGTSSVFTADPANVTSGDSGSSSTAKFTAPSVPGQYKFMVTAGGVTKLATVSVVATASNASNQCQFCHSANKIRTVADTSTHASCQSCHFSGAGHPGSVNAGTVNPATFAVNLDNVTNGNGTAAAKGSNFCESCHGVSGQPAQAVPTLTTHQDKLCSDCHTSAHETHVASATCLSCHAAVHAGKNMGTYGCIDCHNGHQPMANPSPFSSHPAVTLYTFEEIADQMNGGQKVPVQVDASGNGMPYSPKQTCSNTSGCHNYDQISDHAFHSAQGRNEFTDSANGKFDATKNKPWLQSSAMVGKW